MNVFEVGGKVDEMDEMERKVRREKERERKKEREKEEKKERERGTDGKKKRKRYKQRTRQGQALQSQNSVEHSRNISGHILRRECVFVSEYVLHVEKRGKMRSV